MSGSTDTAVTVATAARTSSLRKLALAAFWALLALQFLWHGWWLPPSQLSPLVPLTVFALPLLLPAIGLLRRRPNALFWGAVVSLLHFCHAVSELWTDPAAQVLATAELVLSLTLICALGLDGLRRRKAARVVSQ